LESQPAIGVASWCGKVWRLAEQFVFGAPLKFGAPMEFGMAKVIMVHIKVWLYPLRCRKYLFLGPNSRTVLGLNI